MLRLVRAGNSLADSKFLKPCTPIDARACTAEPIATVVQLGVFRRVLMARVAMGLELASGLDAEYLTHWEPPLAASQQSKPQQERSLTGRP